MKDVSQATDQKQSKENSTATCHHTLSHRTEQGAMNGTWIEVSGAYGIRVSCQVCGKFYGYQPRNQRLNDQQSIRAYLEQSSQYPSS